MLSLSDVYDLLKFCVEKPASYVLLVYMRTAATATGGAAAKRPPPLLPTTTHNIVYSISSFNPPTLSQLNWIARSLAISVCRAAHTLRLLLSLVQW